MASRFQLLSQYFRPCPTRILHCRQCQTSPTTEIQDDGHRNRKWWPPSWIPVTSERRTVSAVSQTSPARWHMRGLPLQTGRKPTPFSSHFHFQFPVTAILNQGGRQHQAVSTVWYPSRTWPKNMGVDVGIAAPSLTVQKLLPLPAWWPPSWISVVDDVGQCSKWHGEVGLGR